MTTVLSGAFVYMQAVQEKLEAIIRSQTEVMDKAAAAIVQAITGGGVLYLFGTGHSHLLAEEGHYRAGGLAAVCPILSSSLMLHEGAVTSTQLERTPGLGPALLSRYRPTERDAIIIFSNSGVNAVPVETAREAKKLGLTVIAVAALGYAARVPVGPSGRKLADVADIVIDNQGVPGDALVEIGDTGMRVGPLSTIAGAFILNALLAEAAMRMNVMGYPPPVYISANMPGVAEHNATLVEQYRSRNPHL